MFFRRTDLRHPDCADRRATQRGWMARPTQPRWVASHARALQITRQTPGARVVLAAACLFTFNACSGDDDSKSDAPGRSASGPACASPADCDEGFTCLSYGGSGGCVPVCTASVSPCSTSASCGPVGVLEVNVCQEPKSADPEKPPAAEEEPRIPCQSDTECRALHPGAICAQWKHNRDCTIPCNVETDCDVLGIGGMSVDFMTCIPDEGNTSRKACLPDERCFSDVMTCVTLPDAMNPTPDDQPDEPDDDWPDEPDDDWPEEPDDDWPDEPDEGAGGMPGGF